MDKIIGGWDRQDVAQAQHDLVFKELQKAETIGPYVAFRWAMDTIIKDWLGCNNMEWITLDDVTTRLDNKLLLDAGCGVGHYAILCERHYPYIKYHGTDISPAMIVLARQFAPLSIFSICRFIYNAFGDYDIILASQVIEQLDDPPAMLDLLLTHAQRYVILNRIRLTPDESRRIEETTYCGEIGRNWLWNREDITQRIEKRAEIVAVNDWATDQMTFVVKVRGENDQPRELCGRACGLDKNCTCH